MIVFDIRCATGHRFEGWFTSAGDFAEQRTRGVLCCPVCGEDDVERVPSATRINTRGAQQSPSGETRDSSRPVPAPSGATSLSDGATAARAFERYARLVNEVLAKTEDVGKSFAEEARKIHYNEAEARPIRGVASVEEHESLLEEGIPVARLPIPPRDQLN